MADFSQNWTVYTENKAKFGDGDSGQKNWRLVQICINSCRFAQTYIDSSRFIQASVSQIQKYLHGKLPKNNKLPRFYGLNHQITTNFLGKSPSLHFLGITKSPTSFGRNHQITSQFWPQSPITKNTAPLQWCLSWHCWNYQHCILAHSTFNFCHVALLACYPCCTSRSLCCPNFEL